MEKSMTGEEVSVGRTKNTCGKPANQKGWRLFQQRPSCLRDALTWHAWDVERRKSEHQITAQERTVGL